VSEETPAPVIDEGLLHATVKWNTLLFAGICGVIGAFTLLFVTYLSLFRGLPQPGNYLNLLGVFLPGYRVSLGGAWVGFFWGGVVGAISGAIIYRVYALSIRQQVMDYFAGDTSSDDLEYIVARLYGHPLGLALGTLTALGLLVTTNLLVLRGTADDSVHAELLAHYFPGYSVSTLGSVIGAIEIFAVTYLFCLLLASVYNGVAALRKKRSRA